MLDSEVSSGKTHFHLDSEKAGYLSYASESDAELQDLERRMKVLIGHHDIVFTGPDVIYEQEDTAYLEARFHEVWAGKRKLVVVSPINGAAITSADAHHGKGGRAVRLRPGTSLIEIVERKEPMLYAIEFGEDF
jgi:hypothetical protein